MEAWLSAAGVKIAALIGGFFGALVSLKFIEGLGKKQRATTVLAGTLVSAYVTPLLITYLELTPKLEGGVAFLCGLFGMSFTGAFIKAIPEWIEAAKGKFIR